MPNPTYAQHKNHEHVETIRLLLLQLPAACADFINSIADTSSSLTRLAYVQDLRLFFHYLSSELTEFAGLDAAAWTNEKIDAITARQIVSFMDYCTLYYNDQDEPLANAELGKMRKLSAVRSFMKFLYKNAYIHANPAALVDMPKIHEKPILRMEIDEMARMLDYVESGEKLTDRQRNYNDNTKVRDLAILTLFLGTGIRVSECVGINIDDVDFSINGFLVTRKGGNQAVLYFSDEVAAALRAYLKLRKETAALPGHEEALFLSLQRKRIGVRAVEKMVKKYATQAAPLKKRLSPHKLRATFGTNLYNETGDIYLVADVLGHADVNTTRRHYAAMSDERRRTAAKAVVLRESDAPKNEPQKN